MQLQHFIALLEFIFQSDIPQTVIALHLLCFSFLMHHFHATVLFRGAVWIWSVCCGNNSQNQPGCLKEWNPVSDTGVHLRRRILLQAISAIPVKLKQWWCFVGFYCVISICNNLSKLDNLESTHALQFQDNLIWIAVSYKCFGSSKNILNVTAYSLKHQ